MTLKKLFTSCFIPLLCVLFLSGCDDSRYKRPASFQNTMERYKNNSAQLKFSLPEGMSFTGPFADCQFTPHYVHNDMAAQYYRTFYRAEENLEIAHTRNIVTQVQVYELDLMLKDLAEYSSQTGDSSVSEEDFTEEQFAYSFLQRMSESLLDYSNYVVGQFTEVDFADKKYFCQYFNATYMNKTPATGGVYVRKHGGLVTLVVIISADDDPEIAQQGFEDLSAVFEK